jgi:hypothetical protein
MAAFAILAGLTFVDPKPVEVMVPRVAAAHLDIKPGSCPNPLDVDHQDSSDYFDSVVPMSLLGNKFSVGEVNLGTVQLTRPGFDSGVSVFPIQITFSDTGTPFEGQPCGCHALGGDGELDIDLKFDKQEIVDAFELEKEADGTFVELQVSGLMKGEFEFAGRDCVRIINH